VSHGTLPAPAAAVGGAEDPPASRPAPRIGGDRLRRWARGAAGGLGFLLAAQAVSSAGIVSNEYLPLATSVLARMVELLASAEFLAQVAATVQSYLIGLGVALLITVPLGVLVGISGAAYRSSRTLIDSLRPIPGLALIPLLLLVFGQGTSTKVILAAWAASWPILLNTIYGVRDVDPVAKETAAIYGIGRWSMLWRVVLPSAGPSIATGVRIASSIALISTVGAELLVGSESGIGAYVLEQSIANVRHDLIYGAVAIAGLVGLVANTTFGAIEQKFFGWRLAKEGRDR